LGAAAADTVGLTSGSGADWVPDVACPDAAAPVDDVPVGVSEGDGEPVPGELVIGVGDGEVEVGDGDTLAEELGDVDGVELADGLPDAEPALQLGDVVGAEEPGWPLPTPPPYG
jgi:hypothetical protein